MVPAEEEGLDEKTRRFSTSEEQQGRTWLQETDEKDFRTDSAHKHMCSNAKGEDDDEENGGVMKKVNETQYLC